MPLSSLVNETERFEKKNPLQTPKNEKGQRLYSYHQAEKIMKYYNEKVDSPRDKVHLSVLQKLYEITKGF